MKNKDLFIRILMLSLAVVVFASVIVMILGFRPDKAGDKVTVGAVFEGECDDEGWNESHYKALKSSCDGLSCGLLTVEKVMEEEGGVRNAVSSLVASGCGVIFFTSYGFGRYADTMAAENPDVAFFSISGECREKNCTSYFARLYQARYIAGIVAGSCSKTGILGYVAAQPNSQTNRGINAYALGARLADPDAKVIVRFTGRWSDEAKEKEAVRLLADKGADVFTYHEDKPYTIEAAEELGLYSTGYDAVYSGHSDKFLTAALYDWAGIYHTIIGDYLSGRTNFSSEYRMGFNEGGVDLYPFSGLVDQRTRELAERERERIETSWRDVFSGEIYDNNMVLRCKEDERISDYELFNGMEWFTEGVEIYEE